MWGSRSNKTQVWNQVQVGDVLLFYTEGHFAAVARVTGKVRDSQIADVAWSPVPDSWLNVLFLGEVQQIDVPVASVAAMLNYAPNWSGPREFFRPALPKQRHALAPYDSLPDFIASLTADSAVENAVTDQSYVDVVGQVADQSDIERLIRKLRERSADAIPEAAASTVVRIERDGSLVLQLKALYDGHCQVCDDTFAKTTGGNYSEAAHIVPLRKRLPGIDSYENLVILCATCHRKLDHGGMTIRWDPTQKAAVVNWQGTTKPLLHNKHIQTSWTPSA
jgi:5-methylcytosine-specific restriction endonuclease McrA